MDEELEEITEGVKNTNSLKSVTTSNVYSTDFTDYSSDKNNSSGKGTYIIDWDESDDSEKSCRINQEQCVVHLTDEVSKHVPDTKEIKTVQCVTEHQVFNAASKISQNKTFVAQETYTQTSKTIIELAKSDGLVVKSTDLKTLQTQTSYVSIIESQRVEYNFYNELCRSNSIQKNYKDNWYEIDENGVRSQILCNSLEDRSSKLPDSRMESEEEAEEKIVESYRCKTTAEESLNKLLDENRSEASNAGEEICDLSLSSNSDIEEDSLMESHCNNIIDKTDFSNKTSDVSHTPKSFDNEIEDIYNKVSNCIGVLRVKQNIEPRLDSQWVGALTPLTEESTIKKESFIDMTPCLGMLNETPHSKKVNESVLFTHDTGLKIKLLPAEKHNDTSNDPFKLPPIQNSKSYHNNVNVLLSAGCENKGNNSHFNNSSVDRWEFGAKNLAAGESQFINGSKSSPLPNEMFQLPPIHTEVIQNIYTNYSGYNSSSNTSKFKLTTADSPCESISIHDKIRELKLTDRRTKNIVRKESRSISPTSVSSPEGSKLCDAAQKGCEAICTELLRKLKSTSWCEVVDTLEEIPKVMDKFWNVITELRIADLLRQWCVLPSVVVLGVAVLVLVVTGIVHTIEGGREVLFILVLVINLVLVLLKIMYHQKRKHRDIEEVTVHVDSPRSQVARTACVTLATILKNTNYTRKPDFYEAVTALLVKTSSFSRPVRRAANMALDDIVCSVDFTQAVTALCVHGVGHKSALVRCAAARLLVVCCAVGGGGRGLLRARPPSAAAARRFALRALAHLLEDRASDARKYAERLYMMLRPLANFEAYFLTDVDVEVASRQMKKFDQLLKLDSKDR